MKCEDILKCHQEIEGCLNAEVASFCTNGLAGNVSVAPGHQIQIAVYPEDSDPNIICCQTMVLRKDAANGFKDTEAEAIAIAIYDSVEKTVAAILQRYGFDVSQLVFICEPHHVESF